jgi:HAE1 family hydrophobic/amphiphilic exporter-1
VTGAERQQIDAVATQLSDPGRDRDELPGAAPNATTTGFGEGPTTIERHDRGRRVAIEADLVGGAPLGEAIDQVMALPSARNLPAGVTIARFGDSEIMEEAFSSFSRAIAAGVLMVLAVLVLLFANAVQPITIICSMPLSVGGAFLALLLTGNAINLSVIIGLLMLMGIVTKNAILLVDFAITEVAGGMERTQALIEAGRKRALPVIMTTDDRGHGSLSIGNRRRRRVPCPHGDRVDRRVARFDLSQPSIRPGRLHDHG